jgi:hypothetical protein
MNLGVMSGIEAPPPFQGFVVLDRIVTQGSRLRRFALGLAPSAFQAGTTAIRDFRSGK